MYPYHPLKEVARPENQANWQEPLNSVAGNDGYERARDTLRMIIMGVSRQQIRSDAGLILQEIDATWQHIAQAPLPCN
ncbi:hypothetical protein [Thermogemmatispora sp.]|uniref:hypothetical protein n=1 Tax=Thermogemmatispora sp. TaxID=1968838 RepID=UPI002ACC0219|nr:hypothetical protein [Thermogemmatispora sp.]